MSQADHSPSAPEVRQAVVHYLLEGNWDTAQLDDHDRGLPPQPALIHRTSRDPHSERLTAHGKDGTIPVSLFKWTTGGPSEEGKGRDLEAL